MSTPPSDLDRLVECLKALAEEHRRLLDVVVRHDAAMRSMDVSKIEQLVAAQETARTRIVQAEARRRLIVAAIARQARLSGEPTLTRIATAFPTHRASLLSLRDELKAVATQIKHRTTVTAKIAQSLLGHLNTAVRLLASAVEKGGTYTRQGAPKLTRRLGSIEAIG